MTKKEIRRLLREYSTDLYHDRVVFRKDGSVELRFFFFYTFGRTAQQYAEKVKIVFPTARILSATEEWRSWPKLSFFRVVFAFGEEGQS